jgi:isocitrate dehydrogenase kinase/phosphatase
VFPEEFATFLLTDAEVREAFVGHHAELLHAEWWQARQESLRNDDLAEVLSYPAATRFAPPLYPTARAR